MTCHLDSTVPSRVAFVAALIATVIALTALPAAAQGTQKSVPLTPEATRLKKVLEQKVPGAEIRSVVKTSYFIPMQQPSILPKPR
jgi:hypothetical protein